MDFKNITLVFAMLAGAILAGCGGGGSSSGSVPAVQPPSLVSIEVTPADPFITKGNDQQMTATGTYSDGSTQNLTSAVTWSSSDSSKITVGQASGLASFVKVGGPVTVTAYGPDNIKGEVTIPARNVMFTTSASGDGILGNWMVNGASITNGQTGLAAADAICANLAQAAGHSGTFKAWLSDDTDDAYCRVAGFSGKKSANCGQLALPTDSGPWVRTDGYPFTEDLGQFFNGGSLYTPPVYDEAGVALASKAPIFTASYYDGQMDAVATTCATWTSTTGTVKSLSSHSSNIVPASDSCGTSARLACFQVGSGAALPPFELTGKKLFLTSQSGTGDLGSWTAAGGKTGIAAGDAICQKLASDAALPNATSFKAWLSDGSVDAKSRFATTNSLYRRLDGVKVADNLGQLTSGLLFTGIQTTDVGGRSDSIAWTGTNEKGTKATDTCADWKDATATSYGGAGKPAYIDFFWTRSGVNTCNNLRRLYCVED